MILKSTFSNVAVIVILLVTSSGIDILKRGFFSYDISLTMWGFLSIGQITLLVYMLGTLIRAVQSTYIEFRNFMLPTSPSRTIAPEMIQSASLQSSYHTSAKREELLRPMIVTRYSHKLFKTTLINMDEAKLIILCYDYFPKLYTTFKPHHKHWQRVDLLFDYIEETEQFEKLAKQLNFFYYVPSIGFIGKDKVTYYISDKLIEEKTPMYRINTNKVITIFVFAILAGLFCIVIIWNILSLAISPNLLIAFPKFTLFIGIMAIILLIANEVLKKRMNKLRETK